MHVMLQAALVRTDLVSLVMLEHSQVAFKFSLR